MFLLLLFKSCPLCENIRLLIAKTYIQSCSSTYRETSSIKVNDIASQIADNVAAAVKATNAIPADGRALTFHYNRQSPKRRRLIEPISADPLVVSSDVSISYPSSTVVLAQGSTGEEGKKKVNQCLNFQSDSVEGSASLSKMVAVLCEQHLFLPLLRAFEMFLPSCSFLPFIRALQVGNQTILSFSIHTLDCIS